MRTAAHYITVNMPQLWTGLKPSTAAGIESGANVAGAGKQPCFTQNAIQKGCQKG